MTFRRRRLPVRNICFERSLTRRFGVFRRYSFRQPRARGSGIRSHDQMGEVVTNVEMCISTRKLNLSQHSYFPACERNFRPRSSRRCGRCCSCARSVATQFRHRSHGCGSLASGGASSAAGTIPVNARGIVLEGVQEPALATFASQCSHNFDHDSRPKPKRCSGGDVCGHEWRSSPDI